MTDDGQNVLKRIMPHSEEGECSILGAVFVDQNSPAVASEHCNVTDFYSKQYGTVFPCMIELFNEGKPVDILTVQEKLKIRDVPSEMQGLDLLRKIAQDEVTVANIRGYAKIVHVKAVRRKLIRVSEEIANSCYADSQRLETLLQGTEEKMFCILQQQNAVGFIPTPEITLRVLERTQEARQNGVEVTGTPTSPIDLDRKLGGLQPLDLVLIVARLPMGKTAFALDIVEHITVRNGRSCIIFLLKTSEEQLANCILSMKSSAGAQKVRNGDLSSSDFSNIIEAAVHISESKNLVIDNTASIDTGELRNKCRKQKLEHGVDLVIIDYLQLINGSGKSNESRQQETSGTPGDLKALAHELQALVIVPLQLSCAVEQRPDHRPMFLDLREPDTTEQDADVAMFSYRDDYYDKDIERPNGAEVITVKQRNGPIGIVNLAWKPDTTRFVNTMR